MKHLTKQWYDLMQKSNLAGDFTPIEDKTYTDEEIQKLYEHALQHEIEHEKTHYNTKPEMLVSPKEIDDGEFELEDFAFIDEENGKIIVPDNFEDVKKQIIFEYDEQLKEFESRPPFDEQETIDFFKEMYELNLQNINFFPKWMIESVDHRLIALDLLPQFAFDRYEKEISEYTEKFEAINNKFDKIQKAQNINEEIYDILLLHDSCLLSLDKVEDNIVITVSKDGFNDEAYRIIVFEKAYILEMEDGIISETYENDYGIQKSGTEFLYKEIYKTDNGYDVHFLLWTPKQLSYLTIECSNITYTDINEL